MTILGIEWTLHLFCGWASPLKLDMMRRPRYCLTGVKPNKSVPVILDVSTEHSCLDMKGEEIKGQDLMDRHSVYAESKDLLP